MAKERDTLDSPDERDALGQLVLAFDVGGSFVKAGLVAVTSGMVVGEVLRRPTPAGATPEDVLDLLVEMARELPTSGPVGLAFPSVAKNGVAWTAANIDKRWIGMNVQTHLQARLQRPIAFLNDADAAGVAEMTMGAGRHRHTGTVMVLTLGTGIGTALFVDGRLVPNTELGHLEVGGREAEHRASAKVRADRQLDWVEWAAEVNVVLAAYHALLWPDVFIVGGGVTENWQHFGSLLTSRAEIVRAAFGNDAGIIGAAMAAFQLGRG
ncbi:MAG TPA: ROK family protein [Steroidobacteraceae bacterium]|nr:ROK family protein [Steroidobacteraceae bacterium]